MRAFSSDSSILSGEWDDDTLLIVSGTNNLAAGGFGSDQLEISGGSFGVLLGEVGQDTLVFSGGTDGILSGGDGDDTFQAKARNADFYGDDGDDRYLITPLSSASANTELRFHELLFIDRETIESESRGSDTIDLSQFAVASTLNLGISAATQSVIAGQLSIYLRGAFENIIGTGGNDVLTGTNQSNNLDGGPGDDQLFGLGGDDTLTPGRGNDIVEGGTGDDHYRFVASSGSLGTDLLREANGGGVDWLDFSELSSAGLGVLDLSSSTSQTLNAGNLTLLLQQSSSQSSAGEFEDVTGTAGRTRLLATAPIIDSKAWPAMMCSQAALAVISTCLAPARPVAIRFKSCHLISVATRWILAVSLRH